MNAHPSFLNFTRSIEPSEGLLFGIDGERRIPVQVQETSIRGSISNHIHPNKEAAETKKAAEPDSANLQRLDAAFLPPDAERLLLTFSVVIQARSLTPSGCNDDNVRKALTDLTSAFSHKGGYRALAERYVWNLANARSLWRNRVAADKKVTIKANGESFEFDADALKVFTFQPGDLPASANPLVDLVAQALSTGDNPLFLEVEISGRLPHGAPVYPSQEFIENPTDKRSKVLSSMPRIWEGSSIRHATLHSQKIGNAIRTIDGWHAQVDELGVTAIEPYGFSQERLKTLRMPGRDAINGEQAVDFYKLLVDLKGLTDRIDKEPNVPDEALYFVAVLIRGGVFSRAKDAKKADAPADEAEAAA